MSHYAKYYNEQIGGGGGGGVRGVFTSSAFQRGRGVGSWLGGLFRCILPYVTSGAKVFGKETLHARMKVIDDVANNGVNFKDAIKLRAGESGQQLKKKAAEKITEIMKGSGYKTTRRVKRQRQSTKIRATTRTSRVKRKKKKKAPDKSRKAKKRKTPALRAINDIFGPK